MGVVGATEGREISPRTVPERRHVARRPGTGRLPSRCDCVATYPNIQKHTITRGEDLICESTETRVFCVRDAQDRRRIHAIPVPEDIRRLCE